jgi:chitodextrinase
MKATITFMIFLVSFCGYSQKGSSFWTSSTKSVSSPIVENKKDLKNAALFELDFDAIQLALSKAPNRFENRSKSTCIVSIPNADGQLEQFQFFQFSNMDPELAKKFPNINSYVGKSIENKGGTIYCSVSPLGFQSMLLNADNTSVFIEPYTKDLSIYSVYKKTDHGNSLTPFECRLSQEILAETKSSVVARPNADDGTLRTYRLALSVTGEYTSYFGGTKSLALAGMNSSMTRVNGVFEKDFGVHMNLIANNDVLIYTNATTDPYSNGTTGSAGAWNTELQNNLTTTIGNAAYDIGHLFGASGGGGNAGCIGCICVDDSASTTDKNKGSGFTSPNNAIPAGDTFDIDYVAHEMGHQFGANHTFTHSNESGSIAQMEPGSGSTIMGYAGITTKDVQPNSDAYFHAISIQQVTNNIKSKTCSVNVATGNAIPTASAGADFTIPKSTPFMLTGSGTDANGDQLTYNWEQMDVGSTTTTIPAATNTAGPNFRSYNSSFSPVRYFPNMTSVLAGATSTNGTEIVVEALPSIAKTMNFRMTVRDNNPNGPANNSDDAVITVNATAGPFSVTSPNTVVSYAGNTSQTITWAVAGTTANGVNCANVDILLSTDGGVTFPITLLAATPNDGTEAVIIPNAAGTTNRIMIKGSGHVFFDVSNTNFTITSGVADNTAPTPPTLVASNTTASSTLLSWYGATDNIAVTSYSIYRNGVLVGTSTSTTYTAAGLSAATPYTFTVKAKDADGNLSIDSNSVSINTLAADSTAPSAPVLNNSLTTINSTFLLWTAATDNIAVVSYDVYKNGFFIANTAVTSYIVTGLVAGTAYTFSVKAKDAAGNASVNSNILNVTTLAPDVTPPTPPTLSASGTTSTSTVLSWSGATDNVGIAAYDVYRGATLVGTTATLTYTVTGLSPLTPYSFSVKAKDDAGNVSTASNVVSITTAEFTYCTSQGNNVNDELIGNVQLGTINNTSVGGNGYTNFTNLSTTLVVGSTQTISITPVWTGNIFSEGYAVFIDYNRDGDFLDVGETVYTRAASTTTPVTGTFTIPLTATIGTTRMRVSMKYNAIPTACETFSFGQVEDYSINFVAPNTTLNLKLYIEGYYDALTHAMTPVLANQGIGSSATDVDEITVELRNASTFAVIATTTAVLKTDGAASCIFNSSNTGSYYIAVKHRSAVQTWSNQPISFASNPTSYDFSNALIKAFGLNLRELEPGVFGLFIGDINQDESIDNSDSTDLFNDIENSNFGFLTTDLNGDGSVDNSDSENFFNNIDNSVFSNHP